MKEDAIEIRTSDGSADGFLYSADGGERRPGVIHLTDIGGVRPSHRTMARQLAEKGYTVLLPNVFYRTGRPPMFDFVPKPGEPRTVKRFLELAAPLTPDAMESDGRAYIAFLSAQPAVRAGKLGIVGYCFTGSMAMRIAAVEPERLAAVASFHGGGLHLDTPTSPDLALPRIRAQLYFGHAVEDRSMPAESIAAFEQALRAWGGRYESEVYDGALRGWTVPDSPVYHAAQAQRAFDKLTALLSAAL